MAAEYKKIDGIIEEQYQAELSFLGEYDKGEYTFESPYIKLNPYLIAPLTALVMFKTENAEQVKVVVKGKTKDGDMTYRPVSDSRNHVIPIYGLYENYKNSVELYLTNGQCKKIEIQTSEAGEKLLKPRKIETTKGYMGDHCMFLTAISPVYFSAFDYAGDCRWYVTSNFVFDLKRSRNGRLLVGSDRLIEPAYNTTGVYEMGMIGKIYNEYRIPGGYHHDHFEMENGNLLILTQILERGVLEDTCDLVDRTTGEVLKTYDFQDVLPVYPHGGSGSQSEYDWFHNNALWYHKDTNSICFSGRHQDNIINLDCETGKLNWILGDPTGWPEDMKPYFFTPVGDVENFDWQYEQHGAVMLPDGDVMCFDNGHWRSKIKEEYRSAEDNFSRGVRYCIDTEKMEIEQVWQYGKEQGSELFSTFIGNVEYYEDGHYLVHFGGNAVLNGEVMNVPPASLRGKPEEKDVILNAFTYEIKADKIMYELVMPASLYRAEKLKLYDMGDVVTFGRGKRLGALGVTKEYTPETRTEYSGIVPDEFKVRIAQEEDRIVLKAELKGQEVVMCLKDENGKERHYLLASNPHHPYLARCEGLFPDEEFKKTFEVPVNKEGLPVGAYEITLRVADKSYDTGVRIVIE